MSSEPAMPSVRAAVGDPRILVFGRLLGAANGWEHLLARALEEETGLDHTLFELLVVVGRAGEGGIAVRDIAQARVLTSGGATRLVQRGVQRGLVERRPSSDDARVQLVELTEEGERMLLRASAVHAANIERTMLAVLPAEHRESFAAAVEALSKGAARALPVMP
ncbi:MarR family winged helix-turn-helix transcriptional regulator [Rathayibacter sp. VKM Ac-2754]|uniref:MarR family winged helix-turn-helix transcriptional regulator n=1 Tax=Rathayibacter sp. VKM Ac-2754 TaxID=2609251 RepID=UPI001359D940|nr:MarR family winged helix-turn-helix transcriptional regulator [Rathayibacter sp. VKM Ac-2754]MWV60314.1 MarR family transcriptional regulator [Rathayibacter sp. VKM Ac-2754]